MMEVYLSAKLQDSLGMPLELVEKMQAFIASTGGVKPRARQVFEISRGIAMWHSKTLDLGELPRDEAFDILRSLTTYAATRLERPCSRQRPATAIHARRTAYLVLVCFSRHRPAGSLEASAWPSALAG